MIRFVCAERSSFYYSSCFKSESNIYRQVLNYVQMAKWNFESLLMEPSTMSDFDAQVLAWSN